MSNQEGSTWEVFKRAYWSPFNWIVSVAHVLSLVALFVLWCGYESIKHDKVGIGAVIGRLTGEK